MVANWSPNSTNPSGSSFGLTSSNPILLFFCFEPSDFKLELTCSIESKMAETRNIGAIHYQLGDLLRELANSMGIGFLHAR
jgi:hypothetical protein